MAENNNRINNNDITQLVRSVVSSLQNLPSTTTSSQVLGSSGSSTGSCSINRNANTGNALSHLSANEELSERFRLPRGQNRSSSSTRPLPRGTSGRFVPYTTAAKASKSKAKSEIIIKDVCLLPSSCWKEVPKRQIKQDLINKNLFIDAWSLDKSWSEQQLRIEIFNLFKGHLSGATDFEFIKSVGNKITAVKLAEGQETNARVVRHISGNGPIYIRRLSDIDDEIDSEDDTVQTLEQTTDIRRFVLGDEPCTSSEINQPQLIPVGSQQKMSQNGWTLCDLEVQQLREMFPDCSDNVIKEASEKCTTVETAIDFIMGKEATNNTPKSQTDDLKNATSLQDILDKLKPVPVAPLRLTVSRSTIFSDCVAFFKQRSFDFKKPLKITFEGEPGIDGGGLRREFFTIAIRSMLSPSATPRLFEGRNGRFLPMHNTDALRANLFKVAGRMVASSIIQGGPGFPVFPLSVYSYFQNPTPDDLTDYLSQEDVVDLDHVIALTKIDGISREDDVEEVAGDVQQLLMETGFPHFLSLDNRFQAMTSLCLHGIILSRKAELDQFVCGLGPLVDVIRQHPKKMEPLFLAGSKNPVTAEEFLSLIVFEDVNDSLKQQFIRYVHSSDTRIPSLLMFATGADAVPPMGFFNPSVITVLQNSSVFPNANTCPMELELPGSVTCFEDFKKSMDTAIDFQEEGFGIV